MSDNFSAVTIAPALLSTKEVTIEPIKATKLKDNPLLCIAEKIGTIVQGIGYLFLRAINGLFGFGKKRDIDIIPPPKPKERVFTAPTDEPQTTAQDIQKLGVETGKAAADFTEYELQPVLKETVQTVHGLLQKEIDTATKQLESTWEKRGARNPVARAILGTHRSSPAPTAPVKPLPPPTQFEQALGFMTPEARILRKAEEKDYLGKEFTAFVDSDRVVNSSFGKHEASKPFFDKLSDAVADHLVNGADLIDVPYTQSRLRLRQRTWGEAASDTTATAAKGLFSMMAHGVIGGLRVAGTGISAGWENLDQGIMGAAWSAVSSSTSQVATEVMDGARWAKSTLTGDSKHPEAAFFEDRVDEMMRGLMARGKLANRTPDQIENLRCYLLKQLYTAFGYPADHEYQAHVGEAVDGTLLPVRGGTEPSMEARRYLSDMGQTFSNGISNTIYAPPASFKGPYLQLPENMTIEQVVETALKRTQGITCALTDSHAENKRRYLTEVVRNVYGMGESQKWKRLGAYWSLVLPGLSKRPAAEPAVKAYLQRLVQQVPELRYTSANAVPPPYYGPTLELPDGKTVDDVINVMCKHVNQAGLPYRIKADRSFQVRYFCEAVRRLYGQGIIPQAAISGADAEEKAKTCSAAMADGSDRQDELQAYLEEGLQRLFTYHLQAPYFRADKLKLTGDNHEAALRAKVDEWAKKLPEAQQRPARVASVRQHLYTLAEQVYGASSDDHKAAYAAGKTAEIKELGEDSWWISRLDSSVDSTAAKAFMGDVSQAIVALITEGKPLTAPELKGPALQLAGEKAKTAPEGALDAFGRGLGVFDRILHHAVKESDTTGASRFLEAMKDMGGQAVDELISAGKTMGNAVYNKAIGHSAETLAAERMARHVYYQLEQKDLLRDLSLSQKADVEDYLKAQFYQLMGEDKRKQMPIDKWLKVFENESVDNDGWGVMPSNPDTDLAYLEAVLEQVRETAEGKEPELVEFKGAPWQIQIPEQRHKDPELEKSTKMAWIGMIASKLAQELGNYPGRSGHEAYIRTSLYQAYGIEIEPSMMDEMTAALKLRALHWTRSQVQERAKPMVAAVTKDIKSTVTTVTAEAIERLDEKVRALEEKSKEKQQSLVIKDLVEKRVLPRLDGQLEKIIRDRSADSIDYLPARVPAQDMKERCDILAGNIMKLIFPEGPSSISAPQFANLEDEPAIKWLFDALAGTQAMRTDSAQGLFKAIFGRSGDDSTIERQMDRIIQLVNSMAAKELKSMEDMGIVPALQGAMEVIRAGGEDNYFKAYQVLVYTIVHNVVAGMGMKETLDFAADPLTHRARLVALSKEVQKFIRGQEADWGFDMGDDDGSDDGRTPVASDNVEDRLYSSIGDKLLPLILPQTKDAGVVKLAMRHLPESADPSKVIGGMLTGVLNNMTAPGIVKSSLGGTRDYMKFRADPDDLGGPPAWWNPEVIREDVKVMDRDGKPVKDSNGLEIVTRQAMTVDGLEKEFRQTVTAIKTELFQKLMEKNLLVRFAIRLGVRVGGKALHTDKEFNGLVEEIIANLILTLNHVLSEDTVLSVIEDVVQDLVDMDKPASTTTEPSMTDAAGMGTPVPTTA